MASASLFRGLRDAAVVTDIGQHRLHIRRGDPTEIDPVASLITADGVVNSDDIIFFGQPDHTSGAVAITADERSHRTARPPQQTSRQRHRDRADRPSRLRPRRQQPPALDAFNLAGGRTIGRPPLPEPDADDFRSSARYSSSTTAGGSSSQSNVLDMDLATLARAASTDVS